MRRQLAAVALILAIVAAAFFWFGRRLVPVASCTDGRQNHGETDIDCGGPCAPCELKSPKPLSVFWSRVTPAGGELFDAAALIENKNEFLASANVNYEFTLFDRLGVVARKTGTTFMYPQERLYVVEPALRTTRRPTRVDFIITDVEWQVGKQPPPALVVERRQYEVQSDDGVRKSVVTADVLNDSPYDLAAFEAEFLVFDKDRNLIGANRIAGGAIPSRGRVTLISIWPAELPGKPASLEIRPRANLYDPHAVVTPH